MKTQRSFLERLFSRLLIGIVSTLFFIFYKWLNRTEVHGREKLLAAMEKGNVVVGCNHLSAWDSFCLAVSLVYPKMMLDVRYAPISSPKFRPEIKPGGLRQKIMEMLNCIFINLDNPRQQIAWLKEVAKRLIETKGWAIIFGTGTRNTGPDFGRLGKWLPGPAALIKKSRATFVPIAILGTQDVLPKGARLPKLFRQVVIVVGDPIVFDDPKDKAGNSAIMAKLVQDMLSLAQNLT